VFRRLPAMLSVPMTTDLSRDEAEELLAPHMTALCDPIYAAWRAWDHLDPAIRQPLSSRTRANWLHDVTVAHAKVTLYKPPVITYTEQPGFLVATVEDKVAVRYKKLDEERGICGIRTDQLKLWRAQQPLPGIDRLTNLVAGYTVSEFGKLESVEIVCLRGYRVLWQLDASPASANIATFPTPVESPEPQVRPVRRDDEIEAGS
jgi:hypothetical protein